MHHVSQPLVVNKPHIDVHFQFSAVNAAIHGFVAVVVEAGTKKFIAEIISDVVIFVGLKYLILE